MQQKTESKIYEGILHHSRLLSIVLGFFVFLFVFRFLLYFLFTFWLDGLDSGYISIHSRWYSVESVVFFLNMHFPVTLSLYVISPHLCFQDVTYYGQLLLNISSYGTSLSLLSLLLFTLPFWYSKKKFTNMGWIKKTLERLILDQLQAVVHPLMDPL